MRKDGMKREKKGEKRGEKNKEGDKKGKLGRTRSEVKVDKMEAYVKKRGYRWEKRGGGEEGRREEGV